MYAEYKIIHIMHQFVQYAKSRLINWVHLLQKSVTNGQKRCCSNSFQFTQNPAWQILFNGIILMVHNGTY